MKCNLGNLIFQPGNIFCGYLAIFCYIHHAYLQYLIKMEANKDEASDCLKKAKELLAQGKIDKARRLANRSKKMYSTDECDGEQYVITTD